MNVELFDDRVPEDRGARAAHPYLTELAQVSDLLVARGPGRDLISARSSLGRAFAVSGREAFVLYAPWAPSSLARSATFVKAFPTARALRGEWLATSSATQDLLGSALAVRETTGSHDSGSWLIGTVLDRRPIHLLAEEGLANERPMTYVLGKLSALLGCAISLDEGDSATFLLKLNSATFEVADEIKQALMSSRP